MFLINVAEYLLMFDFAKYILVAFAFFGVNLIIRKLITNRGA